MRRRYAVITHVKSVSTVTNPKSDRAAARVIRDNRIVPSVTPLSPDGTRRPMVGGMTTAASRSRNPGPVEFQRTVRNFVHWGLSH